LSIRIHEGRLEPQGRYLLRRDDLLLPAAVDQDAGGEAMAMRTATPWWASLVFGFGLLLFFLGERLFGHLSGVRFFLTGLGLLLIVAITAVRAWAMVSSSGARARVERTLLLSHAGTLLGLILYALSTDAMMAKLNLSESGTTHFHGALTVLYLAVLIAANVP